MDLWLAKKNDLHVTGGSDNRVENVKPEVSLAVSKLDVPRLKE